VLQLVRRTTRDVEVAQQLHYDLTHVLVCLLNGTDRLVGTVALLRAPHDFASDAAGAS